MTYMVFNSYFCPKPKLKQQRTQMQQTPLQNVFPRHVCQTFLQSTRCCVLYLTNAFQFEKYFVIPPAHLCQTQNVMCNHEQDCKFSSTGQAVLQNTLARHYCITSPCKIFVRRSCLTLLQCPLARCSCMTCRMPDCLLTSPDAHSYIVRTHSGRVFCKTKVSDALPRHFCDFWCDNNMGAWHHRPHHSATAHCKHYIASPLHKTYCAVPQPTVHSQCIPNHIACVIFL